jgi:hypothetical protein
VAVSVLALALLCGGFAMAQKLNVNPSHHPNLAAAQNLGDRAPVRITDAQKANGRDMDGHAAKAKDLLDQASRDLRQAAIAANKRRPAPSLTKTAPSQHPSPRLVGRRDHPKASLRRSVR